jgi:hypothetical protein
MFSLIETTSSSSPSARPNMARGSRMPRWPSTDQAIGSRWIGLRPGMRTWASAEAMARDRSPSPIGTGAQRHLGVDAVAGQLAAGRADADALDVDAGHGLGPLDGLGDGLRRLVQIDDRPAAHAARLHIADAGRGQGAVVAMDARRPS